MLPHSQQFVQSSIREDIEDIFTLIQLLGEGAFGKVYQCIDKNDGHTYAVKIIAKNLVKKIKIDNLKTQANILANINHPNIVKLYSIHETQEFLYLKMELIQKGTLGKLIRQKSQKKQKFTDKQISSIMKSIFEGVSHIHSFNIIHRDLKPCIKHFIVGLEGLYYTQNR